MMRTYKADLHVHTCLSPCADLKMSPLGIAERAQSLAIDILGICDHNSAENVPALIRAARRFNINVIPGIEVTSQEEIHVLALFNSQEEAFALQEMVYAHLPGENDEEAFGMQVVVNEEGEVLNFNKRLLIGASGLTLEEVVSRVHALGGLAIPAHIDREGFSIITQLGFIPQGLELDALEVSPRTAPDKAGGKFGYSYAYISSSDAHTLEEIGRASTSFLLGDGTLDEIKKALLNNEGRRVLN